MPGTSRRSFLATTASWTLGAFVLPAKSRSPVSSFAPEMIEPDRLRSLAQAAMNTASGLHVDYADIRIANIRRLFMSYFPGASMPGGGGRMFFEFAYGVRVCSGGVWSFAFGVNPNVDDVTAVVKSAADVATRLSKTTIAGTKESALSPAPVVTGEWASPVQIDPFSVSPDSHIEILGAMYDAAARVKGGSLDRYFVFDWSTELRTFASTDGSLITQRLSKVVPNIKAEGRSNRQSVLLPVPGLKACSAGFEIVTGPELQERIKVTTEEAVELTRHPEGEMNVGRYETLMDGFTAGMVLGGTLGRALEANRVLGYEADGAGRSFLVPPGDVIGKQFFSPELNVISDLALPAYGAARWDDDGVETKTFPAIEQGRVRNYFATRASAPDILKANGTAVSWSPSAAPIGCASNLIVTTGVSGTNWDNQLRNIDNGVLLIGGGHLSSDQQLSGGTLIPEALFEIKKGRISRRIKNAAIQFGTKQLWSSVSALGDPSTLQQSINQSYRGGSLSESVQPVVSPSILFGRVNVISLGGSR